MDWSGLATWIGITMSGGVVASVLTRDQIKNWYPSLRKPSLRPPDWVFGPAWTTLYLLMGTAAWMVWSDGGFSKHGFALGLYLIQLLFNFMWTPLFFGAHLLAFSLIEIVILWNLILFTISSFWSINQTAALLLIPYLGWVSFATYLNYSIWKLNP